MSDIFLLLISMQSHDDADDIHTQISSPLPESNEKSRDSFRVFSMLGSCSPNSTPSITKISSLQLTNIRHFFMNPNDLFHPNF